MGRRRIGFSLTGFAALWAVLAWNGPIDATTTPTADGRSCAAQVSAPGGESDSQTDQPATPLQDWAESCSVTVDGMCNAVGGGLILMQPSTTAAHDSFITQSQYGAHLWGYGRTTANLPGNGTGGLSDCDGPGATGQSTSAYLITFTTDTNHDFVLQGHVENGSVDLTFHGPGGDVGLYSQATSGVVPTEFQQVLGPGNYSIAAMAQSDTDDEVSEFDFVLAILNLPPSADGAGRTDQLVVGRTGGADLQLDWGPSCSSDDDDYAIYSGTLGSFTSHTMKQCGTGGATTATISPLSGNRYFLVVPLDATDEGSYGFGAGSERPVGLATCATQFIDSSCP